MRPARILTALALAAVLVSAAVIPAVGAEIRSGMATLVSQDQDLLRRFNRKVRLDGGFFGFGGGDGPVDAQVARKLDRFGATVQSILDMRPDNFRFRVELVASSADVDRIYQQQYGFKRGFIAFFSPKTDTIYVSVADVNRHVFAHELAHAVIHHYFDRAPPTKIHELLAQYVESQL